MVAGKNVKKLDKKCVEKVAEGGRSGRSGLDGRMGFPIKIK